MKITRRERTRRVPMAAVASAAAAAAVGALAVLPATAAEASSPQVKVSAQTIGSMGKVLVSSGKALYVLTTPSQNGCDSACLAIWPALTVHTGSKATAGSGVTKSKLGVTTDAKGAHQVTYGGKPVYWFVEDSKGTVKGDITDEWGKWTAVVVSKPSGSSSTPSTSNSGGSSAGGGGVSF
jgi:predicted lipoprotein with Yx(FWY)xxD motif